MFVDPAQVPLVDGPSLHQVYCSQTDKLEHPNLLESFCTRLSHLAVCGVAHMDLKPDQWVAGALAGGLAALSDADPLSFLGRASGRG